MHISYFTERGYYPLPEDEVLKRRSFFGLPNSFFDPVVGARLLNEYIDDKIYCDEVGFDGVVLNEHHGTPYCMGSVMDVEASVLARVTKRINIILLGNPTPVVHNPLRLAEELAMIDMISGGRLIPGVIRGAGTEQFFNNANPVYNREYFDEAHDLIIQAWTRPGPFRFEGKHFHYRFVNPWVLPLQKPHPPIWIPGVISPETVIWAAQHRYPYIALATQIRPTLELWDIYTKAAAETGYQAGSENFGYMQPVFCAETEEKAEELGKRFLFGGGFTFFSRAEWMFPPGYNSKAATRRLGQQLARLNLWGASGGADSPEAEAAGATNGGAHRQLSKDEEVQRLIGRDPRNDEEIRAMKEALYARYPDWLKTSQMITGTPKTIVPKLRRLLDVLRPGAFILRMDGPLSATDRRSCLKLLGTEVIPALREIGKEFGLDDALTRKPGSQPLAKSATPAPVGNRDALAAFEAGG